MKLLKSEPFRVLFPIGAAAGFVGVAHWGWYYSGLIETYSCNYHGLMMIQGFEGAFAAGFILTAVPRFLDARPAALWEVILALFLIVQTTVLLQLDSWATAQVCFALVTLHLLVFCLRRYASRADSPPASFVFIPVGLALGFIGTVLVVFPIQGFVKLGHRLLEQGMFVCLLLAFGAYLGRRLVDGVAAESLESDPTKKVDFKPGFVLGLFLIGSFVLESGWTEGGGRLIRAAVLTRFFGQALPIFRLPGERRFSSWSLWIGFWSVLIGQWLAGLFPDYEVVALHFTFVGGFSLITFVISTRVVAAHCGPESIWQGKARPLKAIGLLVLFALVGRGISDFLEWYYFGMLHVAAGFWMMAALVWLVAYGRRVFCIAD